MAQAFISRRGGKPADPHPVGTVTNLAAIAGNGYVELTWADPEDILHPVTGAVLVAWARTEIWVNNDHPPTYPGDGLEDGTGWLLATNTMRDEHSTAPLIHGEVEGGVGVAENGTTYHYHAYAYSNHNQASGWDVDGGVSATPAEGILLSTLPSGALIKYESTIMLVLQQGRPSDRYEAGFIDNTIVIMRDIHKSIAWNASGTNDYANSTINAYYNGQFLNEIPSGLRAMIIPVKIPYRPGTGPALASNYGDNGLLVTSFAVSGEEVNWTGASYMPYDGSPLSYFAGLPATDAKRNAYYNGSLYPWGTRSASGAAGFWAVGIGGYAAGTTANSGTGARAAFVLPGQTLLRPEPDADGAYEIIG